MAAFTQAELEALCDPTVRVVALMSIDNPEQDLILLRSEAAAIGFLTLVAGPFAPVEDNILTELEALRLFPDQPCYSVEDYLERIA